MSDACVCVRTRVCAFVRACVHACVGACVCVCVLCLFVCLSVSLCTLACTCTIRILYNPPPPLLNMLLCVLCVFADVLCVFSGSRTCPNCRDPIPEDGCVSFHITINDFIAIQSNSFLSLT